MDSTTPSPTCFKCGRSCDTIAEFKPGLWNLDNLTPAEYVRTFESTYNPASNHFCCSRCLLAGHGPLEPKEWKAP